MEAVNQDTDMTQVKSEPRIHNKPILFSETLQFKSDCHCCQASDYKRLRVHVTCTDGHIAETEVLVPSGCECLQCSTSFTSDSSVSKINNLHHLVQERLDNNAEMAPPAKIQVSVHTIKLDFQIM